MLFFPPHSFSNQSNHLFRPFPCSSDINLKDNFIPASPTNSTEINASPVYKRQSARQLCLRCRSAIEPSHSPVNRRHSETLNLSKFQGTNRQKLSSVIEKGHPHVVGPRDRSGSLPCALTQGSVHCQMLNNDMRSTPRTCTYRWQPVRLSVQGRIKHDPLQYLQFINSGELSAYLAVCMLRVVSFGYARILFIPIWSESTT